MGKMISIYQKRILERDEKVCKGFLHFQEKGWKKLRIYERLKKTNKISATSTIIAILQRNGILEGKSKDRRKRNREN